MKLTYEVREALISGVKEGLTLKAACKYAGISYSTFANWRQKSRKVSEEDEPNPFIQLVAEIDMVAMHLQQQHRLEARANGTPRDYRYGWKNPMPDETRQKLRIKAFEQAMENYQRRRGIY